MAEKSGGAADDAEPDLIQQLAAKGPQDSRYKLQGELARGGMGAIVKIWDKEVRRNLAMKVILGKARDDESSGPTVAPQKLARFLEEAQITGQLDHPGIVPVHEIGLDSQGQVYFTMKLVKGVELREIFNHVRDGKDGWSVTRALGVMSKVCDAMSYAHDKGVIHRDLKPANVMVGKFGEVYVMDWGLARVVGSKETKDIRLKDVKSSAASVKTERREDRESTPDSPLVTMDGDIVGTPAYMAPEQAMGDVERVGARADVYAVGAMLYHLLSGEVPYVPRGAKMSPHTVLLAVLNGPPKPIQQLAPRAPAELIAICEKAMARDPGKRYQTMLELQTDLQAYIEGRVVKAYETGAVAELKKWVSRNKGMAISIAAALLLAIAGIAGIAAVQANAKKDLEDSNTQLEAANANYLRMADVRLLQELLEKGEAILKDYQPPRARLDEWKAEAGKLSERIGGHQLRVAELHALIAAGESDTTIKWQQGVLTQLVSGLAELSKPQDPASVASRIDDKKELWNQTGSLAPEWKAAIESIANVKECPAYNGLKITPQFGLIPIGRDAKSGLWEFVNLDTGVAPKRDADGKILIKEDMGVVLVLVPGGKFWMGAQKEDPAKPNYDPNADSDEAPVHEVTLSPFFIAKYEMTQSEWTHLTARNPSFLKHEERAGMLPVKNISWEECSQWLPRAGLQLPTESQWEYAARAGTSTPWWTGSKEDSTAAGGNTGSGSIDAIGAHSANPFGLHDTIGNVWEWCQDDYREYESKPSNGDVVETVPAGSATRVFRGGGCFYGATYARSAFRNDFAPGFRGDLLGVRPAKVITQ